MRYIALQALAALLLLGACGGTGGLMGGHDHSNMGSEAVTFGKPGTASEVSRTVEVSTLDSLRFDPESIEVKSGETIKFVVTNPGRIEHEFVLGDTEYQRSHGADAAAMDHDTGNGQVVGPGQTAEVIWTFAEDGEVQFACHVDDHYSAGMYGTVAVQ